MLSQEDKQEIKDIIHKTLHSFIPEIAARAAEINLLSIPETVGNMMKEQAIQTKLNKDFYDKYKHFKPCKKLVASVIEKVDSENPGLDYENILKKSVPLIEERISIEKNLNMTDIDQNPNTDFNGVL
jgi:hypothetical protein